MKKLKEMFTTIRMQTLSGVNLGSWKLEIKQVLNFYLLKSLYFILW